MPIYTPADPVLAKRPTWRVPIGTGPITEDGDDALIIVQVTACGEVIFLPAGSESNTIPQIAAQHVISGFTSTITSE